MKPGIDPKMDYAFQKVFGSEANLDLLKHLLEAVLGVGPLDGRDPEPVQREGRPDDKLCILDIKARDADGRWFDVEMQTDSHAAIRPRLLYSWAQLHAGQLVEGQSFTESRPAYSRQRDRDFPRNSHRIPPAILLDYMQSASHRPAGSPA